LQHFLDCDATRRDVRLSGEDALRVEDGPAKVHVGLPDLTRSIWMPVEEDHFGVVISHHVVRVAPGAHLPRAGLALGLDDLIALRHVEVELLRALKRNEVVAIQDESASATRLAPSVSRLNTLSVTQERAR
jgi:hypothetical protein